MLDEAAGGGARAGRAARGARRRRGRGDGRAASAAARCRSPSCRASPARSRRSSPRRFALGEPPVVGIVRDGRLLLDCRTLARRRGRRGRRRRRSARAMPLTVGTAGHIDHGKTWLVRALTGQGHGPAARGAGARASRSTSATRRSSCPDGRRLSLVDVPGHERFVRTMVAGATGIDLFLLVIDAAEGARPQTHEHLAILRLLGVEHGVVARDEGGRASTRRRSSSRVEEARELVPGRRRSSPSARRPAPGSTSCGPRSPRAADRVERDERDGAGAPLRRPRLHAARHRHGRDGDALVGLDRRGRRAARRAGAAATVRVRSVQVHDRAGRARRGGAARRRQPARRRAAASSGAATRSSRRAPIPSSYRLDVVLEELAEIRTARGCTSTTAPRTIPRRVVRVGDAAAQLRLAAPVVAARGDRVVLRARDDGRRRRACSTRRRRGTRAPERIGAGRARRRSPAIVHEPVRCRVAAARCSTASSHGRRARRRLGLLARVARRAARRSSTGGSPRADPLDPGVPPPAEPWAAAVVPLLGLERRGAKLYRPGATAVARRARRGGRRARGAARARAGEGRGRRSSRASSSSRAGSSASATATRSRPRRYERARDALVAECEAAGRITLARFRDLLGVGRRDGAAPARALRRRRPHAPRRRRARAAPAWNNRDMTPDEVTELIERYNAAWNAQDLDAIARACTIPRSCSTTTPPASGPRARRGARAHRRDLPQQPDAALPRRAASTRATTSPSASGRRT